MKTFFRIFLVIVFIYNSLLRLQRCIIDNTLFMQAFWILIFLSF